MVLVSAVEDEALRVVFCNAIAMDMNSLFYFSNYNLDKGFGRRTLHIEFFPGEQAAVVLL